MNSLTFPQLLRHFRTSLRISQEELSFRAEVSTRHLSCLETGRAAPSREMVTRLAGSLDLPLRDRNRLLVAAGFAAVYPERGLDSASWGALRQAVDLIFDKQEPYGALMIDRGWNTVRTNRGAALLLGCFVDPECADPAVAGNLVRALLHPSGLRPSVVNWVELAGITLERLSHECAQYPYDEQRAALLDEVRQYPGVSSLDQRRRPPDAPFVAVHLRRGDHEARIFTMLTTLGTPLDVSAQEFTIETYFPADEATDRWWRSLGNAP
jgi:transcriptional regulator with XRE-family HTH domain